MRNLLRLIVKYNFILLFILLEGIGMVLIFQFDPFHKSFASNISRAFFGNVNSRVANVRDYLFLKDENTRLNEENVQLRQFLQKNSFTVYLNLGNQSESDTLAVVSDIAYEYLPAEVLNNSVNKQYNYLTLNKGSLDSVSTDMAVVSGRGIVGVVLSTSEHFATVQPLINRNSRTGARIKGEEYFGILEWDGVDPDRMQLREIPIHVNIEPGDTIETSGYSSIFPKGEPIGTIESITMPKGNFYEIDVRLFVNFRTLNHVVLIRNKLLEEQENLEGGEE